MDDFARGERTYDGETRTVFTLGTGPAVVVVSEIPGITPQVGDFARRVAESGHTVALPVLFGTPGKEFSGPYVMSSMTRACVSREFVCLKKGATSPVTSWLRALARDLHAECGGPGVGAVGMCLTGGFALAMMVDPVVVAPVLSQPSLPFPIGRGRKRDLGIDASDLAAVKARVDDGCPVLALRFSEDPLVPSERFDRLRDELGEGFLAVEIDSSPDNEHGIGKRAHSVLTADFVDEPGHPTRDALDQVLAFFGERLLVE